MSSGETERGLNEFFNEALERSSQDRAAFLESACGKRPALRARLEALLAAYEEAPSFLEDRGPTLDSTVPKELRHSPDARPADRPKDQNADWIGPYHILEQLGSGGMGIVYLAEQTEPIRRRVAIKLIKLGMDSERVLARFEAERQALAMMDHPNVAKVFDAGATDTGRPYFVMEHVPGVPIAEHCDRHRLTIEERLELFMLVCDAVQHAHQKGVIHRDIKPSNILVSAKNGGGVPKVIDFGVAKAMLQPLTEKTVFTEQGQLIGTPEYMSPEQAEMTAQDIDTRSDIYSLGVLLYELLTGERPFSSETLRQAGLAEIQRIIREEDPPKPSTRLSSLCDASATRARSRRADPRTLTRSLKGDLDWIVMKAIEKDRSRRYDTANGLAADLRRHLNHEPVLAGPPSTRYRVAKFARRNRLAVSAASAVLFILLAGIAGATWGLVAAVAAKEETQEALDDLELVAEFQASQLSGIDVELMAVRLRDDLLSEARAAMERSGLDEQEVANRTERLEELLAGVNLTNVALGTLDRNIFERALKAVDEQFADQELVRARLLETMADTLRAVGLLEAATAPQIEALEVRRRVLGDEHPDTLESVISMGFLLHAQGKLAEAEPYYRETLEVSRRVLGDEHPHTLDSVAHMGFLLQARGKPAEAEPYYREALDGFRRVLGDEHPDTLDTCAHMGALLHHDLWKLAEAEPYYREALEGRRRILGDEHPDTLSSVTGMAELLHAQGKLAEAEPYYREALDVRRRILGDEHPHTLTSVTGMAELLNAQGKLAEAEPYSREALEGRRRILGDEHPDTLTSVAIMGFLLQAQGKLTEAEPYYRKALDVRRRVLGDEHPHTLMSVNNMGFLLQAQGKLAEAEPYYREALEVRRRVLSDEHPALLYPANNMAAILNAQRRYEESEPLARESVERGKKVLGADHWQTAEARSLLGEAIAGQQRYQEAEPLLLEGHVGLDAALPAGRRTQKLPPSIERLVRLYEAWGKPDKANEWRSGLESIPGRNDE